jgi:hypothetical protein
MQYTKRLIVLSLLNPANMCAGPAPGFKNTLKDPKYFGQEVNAAQE